MNAILQGLNIPKLPFIVQYQLPDSLCMLMQRFGRGARDPSISATCLLLVEPCYLEAEQEKKRKKSASKKKAVSKGSKKEVKKEAEGSPLRRKRKIDAFVRSPSPSPTSPRARSKSREPSPTPRARRAESEVSDMMNDNMDRLENTLVEESEDGLSGTESPESSESDEESDEENNPEVAVGLEPEASNPVTPGTAPPAGPQRKAKPSKSRGKRNLTAAEDKFINAGRPSRPRCRRDASNQYFENHNAS